MDNNISVIADSLRRIQTEGGDGNFVIFTADVKKNYFVQFAGAQGKTDLYAEAVGNEVLPRGATLQPNQIARLQAMGWNPPVDSPNFNREWKATNDEERLSIAREVMRVLVEIYGMQPDQPLAVELELQ
jgi:hypothetical protein